MTTHSINCMQIGYPTGFNNKNLKLGPVGFHIPVSPPFLSEKTRVVAQGFERSIIFFELCFDFDSRKKIIQNACHKIVEQVLLWSATNFIIYYHLCFSPSLLSDVGASTVWIY